MRNKDRSQTKRWQILDDSFEPSAALEGDSYSLSLGRSSNRKLSLYDSFDRLLMQNGQVLVKQGNSFGLASTNDISSAPLKQKAKTGSNRKALFWWDFESTELQKALRKPLKLRAASPLADIDFSEQELLLRNADQKIIARLRRQNVMANGQTAMSLIQLSPLLGYQEEAEALAKKLEAHASLKSECDSLAEKACATAGKGEQPLSAKKAPKQDPELRAQTAIIQKSRFLSQVAFQNEPGIIDDIDTEFLHDYRVSIRKIRSMLSLLNGVFPREETRWLKARYGLMAKATNRMRDLDVYLLEEGTYLARLSPSLQAGLKHMFDDFRAERKLRLKELKTHLRSKAYQEEKRAVIEWFQHDAPPSGPLGELSISALASQQIYRHYRKVRKLGKRLDDDTPDPEVHALRIECKKLRYLLELFEELFPSDDLSSIKRDLKRLQESLGNFNDFAVQQESLHRYLTESKRLPRQTAASVGALIESLHLSQKEARGQIEARFVSFNGAKTDKIFANTFKGKKQQTNP